MTKKKSTKKKREEVVFSFTWNKGLIASLVTSFVTSATVILILFIGFNDALKNIFSTSKLFNVGVLFFIPLFCCFFLYGCGLLSCFYDSGKKKKN
jgi:hypothetical protein